MSVRRLFSYLAVMSCVLVTGLVEAGPSAAILGHPFIHTFGNFTRVQSIAVDDISGDVYVYDMGQGGGSLFKFDSEGNPAKFSGLPGEPTAIEGIGSPGYNDETEIAVDNSAQPTKGDIYVATNNHVIKVIGPDGKALGSIGEQAPAPWGSEPCGVAVDMSGNVYVGFYQGFVNEYANNPSGVNSSNYTSTLNGVGHVCNIAADSLSSVFVDIYGNGPVTRYAASAFGPGPGLGSIVDQGGSTLAVDPGNDEVYVDDQTSISQFGAHGEPFEQPVNTFGKGKIAASSGSFGVAVNGVTHNVYVSAGGEHVALYGPYGPEPAIIENESVTSVGYEEATLHATINPNESQSVYHFEWGLDSKYGATGPIPDVSVGAGNTPVTISQPIAGLKPGMTYHFRVVTTTAEGAVSDGADQTLTTYQAARPPASDLCPNAEWRTVQFATYLPDCRAYELVSPQGDEKEGTNISTYPTRTRSSANGNAAMFVTKAPYGNASGSETAGAEYVAQRGNEGWSSYSVTPEQKSLAFSLLESSMYQGMSSDLSKGVFFALTPVVGGHPNVELVPNLYLRANVLTSPIGSYELLSDAATPLPPAKGGEKGIGGAEIAFAAASEDWTHIVFESSNDLTAETVGLSTERPKAYEWYNGTVRLVGMLPKNGGPAEGSVIGHGVGGGGKDAQSYGIQPSWATHAISADGSRVIFTGWPLETTGGNSGPQGGALYMRIDGNETIQLNVSERQVPDPNGSKPAIFANATPDDSKVFFITSEALTDNTPIGSGNNLYMYDLNAPEGHRLTLISVDMEPAGSTSDNRVEGVPGISSDGSYVYFFGSNDLLPGMPPLDRNVGSDRRLYLWHNGELRFVVTHQDNNDWFNGTGWDNLDSLSYGNNFRVSSDGKTIAFLSSDPTTAGRVGYNNAAGPSSYKLSPGGVLETPCRADQSILKYCYEVYTYNADTNTLACASCNLTGEEAMSDASVKEHADTFGIGQETQYLNNFMSSDGRYVFFDTREALVPEDVNGETDVYEYDTITKRVYLISSGTCGCASYFVDASADGSNVFFTTHQRLVHVDVDTAADLYDARIDGGIPAQNRPPAAECFGEECQGPTASPPVISLPASSTFSGPGNAVLTGGQPGATAAPKAKRKSAKQKARHRKKRKKGRKAARRASRRTRR